MCVVNAQNCEQCVLMCHCAGVSLCGSSMLFVVVVIVCLLFGHMGGGGRDEQYQTNVSNIYPVT